MEAVLNLLHVLLQQHHVVHVLLAGHVDSQVSCHIGLVVANLLEEKWNNVSVLGSLTLPA